MSEKTPQAGDWWFCKNGDRVYIVGLSDTGKTVFQADQGGQLLVDWFGWKDWHHEPACDSWTWQPETFPQYVKTLSPEFYAYIRVDSAKLSDGVFVRCDGTEEEFDCLNESMWLEMRRRDRLTREQAEALVERPVEEPQVTDVKYTILDGQWVTPDGCCGCGKQLDASGSCRDCMSQPADEPCITPERWFIWSDNRYPIAFCKHADGTVQNLNVNFEYKNSDPWGERWQEQIDSGELTEVSASQAIEHLKKPWRAEPPAPAESPDDWVTQDRVAARPGIDQRNYQYNREHAPPEYRWEDSSCMNWNEMPMHGQTLGGSGGTIHLRCRRKDLPPLPELEKLKTRKVVLNSVVFWDDEDRMHFDTVETLEMPRLYNDWKRVHVYETREVEVPL